MPDAFFSSLAEGLRLSVEHDWRTKARPAQLPPSGIWSKWLLRAGRGFGKTFTGSNYTNELAAAGAVKRIALVAPNDDHGRQVMIEGNSGLLALAPPWCRPVFERGQLTWPSGTIATLYSAESPEALRGPEFDFAWCDELASWRYAEAWDNLLLALRIGTQPRVVITTTPKPSRLIKELIASDGKDGVVVTGGSTYDNRANLSPQFFNQLVRKFEGTRAGEQELLGKLLLDVPGALWNLENLEETRVERAPSLQRIVIGVDPAGSAEPGADLTGIVACGLGHDGHLYFLADVSCRGSPREWATKVCALFHSCKADKIVIERNFGGAMAAATLMSVDPGLPVKEVSSSRGKVLRAEPVSSLSEQGRAHIVGRLEELEEQMCSFTSDWDRDRDGSPDRVDAAVFAATELMAQEAPAGYFSITSLLEKGEPVPMPFRPRQVFAVGVADDGQATFSVLILARMHADRGRSLILLDWGLAPVGPPLFEGEFLDSVFERMRAVEALEASPSFWIRDEGIGTALLRQGAERGLDMWDIDYHLDLPPDLPTLISDVSASIHGGQVGITAEAYREHATLGAVTRNFFIAHLEAYRVGAEKPADCPMLRALAIALILAAPTAVRRKSHRRRTA